jgi:acetylglutamate kinase
MHDGVAAGGMRAKLTAAVTAVQGNVPLVRISDLRGINDRALGTRIQRGTE